MEHVSEQRRGRELMRTMTAVDGGNSEKKRFKAYLVERGVDGFHGEDLRDALQQQRYQALHGQASRAFRVLEPEAAPAPVYSATRCSGLCAHPKAAHGMLGWLAL